MLRRLGCISSRLVSNSAARSSASLRWPARTFSELVRATAVTNGLIKSNGIDWNRSNSVRFFAKRHMNKAERAEAKHELIQKKLNPLQVETEMALQEVIVIFSGPQSTDVVEKLSDTLSQGTIEECRMTDMGGNFAGVMLCIFPEDVKLSYLQKELNKTFPDFVFHVTLGESSKPVVDKQKRERDVAEAEEAEERQERTLTFVGTDNPEFLQAVAGYLRDYKARVLLLDMNSFDSHNDEGLCVESVVRVTASFPASANLLRLERQMELAKRDGELTDYTIEELSEEEKKKKEADFYEAGDYSETDMSELEDEDAEAMLRRIERAPSNTGNLPPDQFHDVLMHHLRHERNKEDRERANAPNEDEPPSHRGAVREPSFSDVTSSGPSAPRRFRSSGPVVDVTPTPQTPLSPNKPKPKPQSKPAPIRETLSDAVLRQQQAESATVVRPGSAAKFSGYGQRPSRVIRSESEKEKK